MVSLPVLPLKNTVLFPYLFMPLSVGRPDSLAAVEAVLATEEKTFVVVAQRDADNEQPGLDDLYTVGTRAVIKKMARGEGGIELMVQGVERVALVKAEQTEPYLKARVRRCRCPRTRAPRSRPCTAPSRPGRPGAGAGAAASAGQHRTSSSPRRRTRCASPTCSARCSASTWPRSRPCSKRRRRAEALRLLHGYLAHELQVLELRQKITSQAQTEMSKQQREYMLRQQLRAIQDELGEKNPEKAEVEELRRRLTEADLPDEVRKEAERELSRLERLPPAAPDYQVTRTYLDLVLELPWQKTHARTPST